ncbi:MAG: hypothetical protein AB7E84_12930 [Xanthobacteraceae bacterium]
MSIPNRFTLDDITAASIGEIAGLPAEQLALLQQDVGNRLASVNRLKDRLDSGLDLKYRDRAAALRSGVGKDAGTVRIEDGDVVVVAELQKRVDWDQRGLAAVVERIRAAGDDPAEYIEVTPYPTMSSTAKPRLQCVGDDRAGNGRHASGLSFAATNTTGTKASSQSIGLCRISFSRRFIRSLRFGTIHLMRARQQRRTLT